jgi:hypothetical protein
MFKAFNHNYDCIMSCYSVNKNVTLFLSGKVHIRFLRYIL